MQGKSAFDAGQLRERGDRLHIKYDKIHIWYFYVLQPIKLPTKSPIEDVIDMALNKQKCTAAQLAERLGMAASNFSLARNSRRSFPLAVLLSMFELAEISAEERIKVLEWVAFKQFIGVQK